MFTVCHFFFLSFSLWQPTFVWCVVICMFLFLYQHKFALRAVFKWFKINECVFSRSLPYTQYSKQIHNCSQNHYFRYLNEATNNIFCVMLSNYRPNNEQLMLIVYIIKWKFNNNLTKSYKEMVMSVTAIVNPIQFVRNISYRGTRYVQHMYNVTPFSMLFSTNRKHKRFVSCHKHQSLFCFWIYGSTGINIKQIIRA